MSNKRMYVWLGLLLALFSTPLYAGTWQVGVVAENSRSPFLGDRRETNFLPVVSYVGERFSYVGGGIEYILDSGKGGQVYTLGKIRQRQFYSASLDLNDDPGIEGMEERDQAVELGLGVKDQTTSGKYAVELALDATGVHKGYELLATYSYPKQMGRWLIEPAISLQWQSSGLVNYYHGVRDSEARAGRPAYKGGQAINRLVSLTVAYTLHTQWLAIASAEQMALDTSITDSPIVTEKQLAKFSLGLIHAF